MIYLDNAATTGQKPTAVYNAINEAMMNLSVNAGRGSYTSARKATAIIDECRNRVLQLANIHSDYHVYFSPSATVALNQLIQGLACDPYSTIYVSPFEHNAVMRPVYALTQKTGCNYAVLPFDRATWQFDVEKAESMFLSRKPSFVLISMVSNTTGFILPVSTIVELAHKHGAKVIVDCAQAFGAIATDYRMLDADAYVFAGHKTLYGPFGIAGIILSDRWQIEPSLYGGTGSDSLNLRMPAPIDGGYEPGSPNIPAICGLNSALQWLEATGVSSIAAHEQALLQRLVNGLSNHLRIQMYQPPQTQHSGILAFNVQDYQSHDVGEILDDEFDIAVRTGYQCAPLVHNWLGTKSFGGIVRASVSYFNSESDIGSLIQAINSL